MGLDATVTANRYGLDGGQIIITLVLSVGSPISIVVSSSDFQQYAITITLDAGDSVDDVTYNASAAGAVTTMVGTIFSNDNAAGLLVNGWQGNGAGQFFFSLPIAAPAPTPVPKPRGARRPNPQVFYPNFFDLCLARNFRLLDLIDPHALSCNRPPRCYSPDEGDYDTGEANRIDYLSMPANGVPFIIINSIPLPDPADGDVNVISGQVPIGYDGRVTGYFHFYDGPNFAEGSGDIVWRAKINLYYVRDMGQMLTTQGGLGSLMVAEGGPRLQSGQFFKYQVNAPNTSGALPPAGIGNIICGLHGYYYPRK